MLYYLTPPYVLHKNIVLYIYVFTSGSLAYWSTSGKELACQCRGPKKDHWDRSLGGKDALEDGMATHSSILAWRISWTETCRLNSWGRSRRRLKRQHARTKQITSREADFESH